jgi:hypothetical protein
MIILADNMRLVLLATLLSPALLAQNFRGKIQLKPLVPPLSKPWPVQPSVSELSMLKPLQVQRPCSIRLLESKPNEVDSQMRVTPPPEGFHVRVVTPPAPACDEKPKP